MIGSLFFSLVFFDVFIEFCYNTAPILWFGFWLSSMYDPWAGIEPGPPVFKSAVLTTGLSGKSLDLCSTSYNWLLILLC